MIADVVEPERAGQPALRRLQTDAELHAWILTYLGVDIPRKQVCEHHCAPFQALADAYFARHPRVVWKASRGFGTKTVMMAALGLAESVTLGASVTILGGSGKQSQRVLEYMNGEDTMRGRFWAHPTAPRWLLRGDPTRERTRLTNGGTITALMASSKSIRGPHPQRLRGDEIDEMDRRLWDAAQGQPLAHGDVMEQTVGCSTHQYLDGTMTRELEMAAERGWPVYEWCVHPDTRIATPHGEIPIAQLSPRQEVYGLRNGEIGVASVRWVGPTRTSETIGLYFEHGQHLRCTPDHWIATPKGWRPAQSLEPGDAVLCGLRETDAFAFVSRPQKSGEMLAMFEAAETLRAMWHGHPQDLCSLLGLSSQISGGAQQDAGGSIGIGPSLEDLAEANVETGTASTGVAERAWLEVDPSRRDGAVHSGPRRSSFVAGDRRARQLLALATGRDRTRPTAGGNGQDVGPSGCGVAWRSSASVVASAPGITRLLRVEPGPQVEVWDLRVPGLDSFIADGVVVHNCYRETVGPHGVFTMEEVDRKRGTMTRQSWETEVELQEPSGEDLAIDAESVDVTFNPELGEYPGAMGDVLWLEDSEPDATYATGVDFGKKRDKTIVWTFRTDVTPYALVGFGHFGRLPYPQVMQALHKQVERYPGPVYYDAGGPGTVTEDLFEVEATPVNLVGRRRAQLFRRHIASIESREWVAPRIVYAYREHRFVSVDDLFGAGHPPDTFVAAALAFDAADEAPFIFE